jgi:hypothetical protein
VANDVTILNNPFSRLGKKVSFTIFLGMVRLWIAVESNYTSVPAQQQHANVADQKNRHNLGADLCAVWHGWNGFTVEGSSLLL